MPPYGHLSLGKRGVLKAQRLLRNAIRTIGLLFEEVVLIGTKSKVVANGFTVLILGVRHPKFGSQNLR